MKHNVEADATLFGSAIHKALEHWYCLPEDQRELTPDQLKLTDTLIALPLDAPPLTGALESIRQFTLKAEPLRWLGDGDKRSIDNGIKILKHYFKHYLTDGLEVLLDSTGKPMVERECEFKLYEDNELEIIYHGTIDMIVRNKVSGHTLVCDHKTTASLGTQFYNRIKPNHQYTGYIMAAQKCLGIDTTMFMVNGIQVAKTKAEFARQTTERNEDDFQEMTDAVVTSVKSFLSAMDSGVYPMSAPNSCANYGSCQYLDICSSPKALRETIIQSKYAEVM